MISGKAHKQREGEPELTPAVIESAALEIIQNAQEILDMYGIAGTITNLGLGLMPILKKTHSLEDMGYELSFLEHKEFGFSVQYNLPSKN